jgi:uncharacterized membrane protein YbaN (DUF454 family)
LAQRHVKRLIVLCIGWGLIVIGVIGLFLPVLQGVLFILVGLYVLSRESRRAHELFERLRAQHPGLDAKLRDWKNRLKGLRRTQP